MRREGILIALALIGAGYFGPWVWHKDVSLILSADDLAEWLKFMPIVGAGQSGIIRELFYIPIWLTSIGLGVLAGHVKSIGWRLALVGLSLLLVFTPLPKYPELLTAYQSSDFAPTFWITIGSMVISFGLAIFGSRLSDRVQALVWIGIGFMAASIAPLHFVKVVPEIERLYPFSIGWGIFAVAIGGMGLTAIGVRLLMTKRNRSA